MIIRKQQLLYWTLQEHFAKEMYAKAWSKIKDGNNRRPDPWTYPLTWLQGRLQDEIEEYAKEPEMIGKADELLDIANFCFYLYTAIINDWQNTKIPISTEQSAEKK